MNCEDEKKERRSACLREYDQISPGFCGFGSEVCYFCKTFGKIEGNRCRLYSCDLDGVLISRHDSLEMMDKEAKVKFFAAMLNTLGD